MNRQLLYHMTRDHLELILYDGKNNNIITNKILRTRLCDSRNHLYHMKNIVNLKKTSNALGVGTSTSIRSIR